MKKLDQSFSVPFTYSVYFTRGLFEPSSSLLAGLFKSAGRHAPARVLVVLDEGVHHAHPQLADQIRARFDEMEGLAHLCGPLLLVPGGEASKNDPEHLDRILQAVNEHGIDRHNYLVGIGGGAVLDLAGFAAAVAHRGIRHIRIPTTVLSQNDSGVGVKNGINYFGKKNFLGTFAPPLAVVNDYDFLHTLDDRDWRAGIAEAVKVALIKDEAFFDFLEQEAERLAQREEAPMEHLIEECARLHMEHIAGGDPFELGSSRPLDFGHWAAHKLEQLTDFRLRHGEAVAIGIALDVTYAFLQGMIRQPQWERIIRLLKNLGFSLFAEELGRREGGRLQILDGLEEFRQHLGGQLTIMLLDDIGSGIEVNEMDRAGIENAVHHLQHHHQRAIV